MRLVHLLIPGLTFFKAVIIAGHRPLENTNMGSTAENRKLKITVGEKKIAAVLYNNPTSKEFAALLPLTLELEDFNGTEKIGTLSKKLSTRDAPSGFDPSVGDITYYAPWGNLAFFYKDFRYSEQLISIGKITNGIEVFNVSGSVKIKMELE
jgi:hypothetical protein